MLSCLLLVAINKWYVVIGRAAIEQVVATVAEGLSSIGSYTDVNDNRFRMAIDNKVSDVIVVMVLVVMPPLGGNKEVVCAVITASGCEYLAFSQSGRYRMSFLRCLF